MNSVVNIIKNVWHTIGLPKFLVVFIAVWSALVIIGVLPFGDLSGYDDAVYAHEARVMVQSGDWCTMNLNGNPDFDKPPLFIWLIALSFKVFGATDFAAKLPAGLLGWATILLVYFLAKELFTEASKESEADSRREWLPVLSMLCLATTQYFLKYSSHAMTDVPFTFFFTLAVYFYVRALKNNGFLLLSGMAIGLATLTRSPMGLFPLGIIISHLVLTRRYKLLFSSNFFGCLLLTLAIPANWYLQQYNLFGDLFINKHFENIAGHSATTQMRTFGQQFLWYFEYIFLIIKSYLPWFPLMFYGLFLSIRDIRGNKSRSIGILLIVWILVVLTPFSLAESKVLRYILPVFPAFAILSAFAVYRLFSPKSLAKISSVIVLLLTLAAIIIVGFPNYLVRAEDMHTLASFSDAASEPNEKVILYTDGQLQWNYQNQLLWYGNRNTILIKDKNEIENLLIDKKKLIIIMDKSSFDSFSSQTKSQLTILGQSKNFICFHLSITK